MTWWTCPTSLVHCSTLRYSSGSWILITDHGSWIMVTASRNCTGGFLQWWRLMLTVRSLNMLTTLLLDISFASCQVRYDIPILVSSYISCSTSCSLLYPLLYTLLYIYKLYDIFGIAVGNPSVVSANGCKSTSATPVPKVSRCAALTLTQYHADQRTVNCSAIPQDIKNHQLNEVK